MTVTDTLLSPLLRSDPARPRITHYDDGVGSRIELSGVTLTNWAAKTANWLRDELGVTPGDRVGVMLPPHWQTAGVLLGAWWVGAVISNDAVDAEVAFCTLDGVVDAAGAAETAVVSLDPLGAGLATPPPGTHDYASSIRVHGDTYATSGEAGPDARRVLDAARSRASSLGLVAGARLLSTEGWDGAVPGELLAAVLVTDASLVQCTGTDPALLDTRARTEQVSHRL